MKKGIWIVLAAVLLMGVLYAVQKHEPEVVSLLGKKLFADPAEGEALEKLKAELTDAEKAYRKNPTDPEAIIMYGRRWAYLWHYNKAIKIYSRGLELHPGHAMLYRHRGHRYISTRRFSKAAEDMARAAELNNKDFDIWYHLGLAHYLKGEFKKALEAYKECLKVSEDDDAKIAISNWLYITHRRLGDKAGADTVLDGITGGLEVVENQSYYDLLFFYKGQKSEEEIRKIALKSDLEMATIGYGFGCWYLYNDKPEIAKEIFMKIIEGKYWPAFGYIAAEAELFRMKEYQK